MEALIIVAITALVVNVLFLIALLRRRSDARLASNKATSAKCFECAGSGFYRAGSLGAGRLGEVECHVCGGSGRGDVTVRYEGTTMYIEERDDD